MYTCTRVPWYTFSTACSTVPVLLPLDVRNNSALDFTRGLLYCNIAIVASSPGFFQRGATGLHQIPEISLPLACTPSLRARWKMAARNSPAPAVRTIVRRASIADVPAVAPLFNRYRMFYQQPSDEATCAACVGAVLGGRGGAARFAQDHRPACRLCCEVSFRPCAQCFQRSRISARVVVTPCEHCNQKALSRIQCDCQNEEHNTGERDFSVVKIIFTRRC